MTFQKRLQTAMRGGNLRVADLARWFDRPHATVRGWAEQGISPGGGPIDVEHVHAMLDVLEALIRKKLGLPVPRLSPQKRIQHLAAVRSACLKAGEKRGVRAADHRTSLRKSNG